MFSDDIQDANFKPSPTSCCGIILVFPDTKALNICMAGTRRFFMFCMYRIEPIQELFYS